MATQMSKEAMRMLLMIWVLQPAYFSGGASFQPALSTPTTADDLQAYCFELSHLSSALGMHGFCKTGKASNGQVLAWSKRLRSNVLTSIDK
mmetsp:Transcript_42189/g.75548  ORF Transcript_42189/g.75548 Transcript_42189/m.75548 type:complete len:91 (-) Transcript_42189:8-280(-)